LANKLLHAMVSKLSSNDVIDDSENPKTNEGATGEFQLENYPLFTVRR